MKHTLALLALVGACSDIAGPAHHEQAAVPDVPVAGLYQLTRRNSEEVPILIATNHHVCTESGCVPTGLNSYMVAQVITLHEDGTYTRATTSKLASSAAADGESTTLTSAGTYRVIRPTGGQRLLFLIAGNASLVGELVGGTLTLTIGSDRWVYTRLLLFVALPFDADARPERAPDLDGEASRRSRRS